MFFELSFSEFVILDFSRETNHFSQLVGISTRRVKAAGSSSYRIEGSSITSPEDWKKKTSNLFWFNFGSDNKSSSRPKTKSSPHRKVKPYLYLFRIYNFQNSLFRRCSRNQQMTIDDDSVTRAFYSLFVFSITTENPRATSESRTSSSWNQSRLHHEDEGREKHAPTE